MQRHDLRAAVSSSWISTYCDLSLALTRKLIAPQIEIGQVVTYEVDSREEKIAEREYRLGIFPSFIRLVSGEDLYLL